MALRHARSGRKIWSMSQAGDRSESSAELAVENGRLRERIRRMEDERPFLRWRARV
jgi:hypothetical protein